jgi:peptide/nickel transport system permease protein
VSELVVAGGDHAATRGDEPRAVSTGTACCFAVIGVVVVLAILGGVVAPQDPAAQDLSEALAGPSPAHWLGTDALGRDVLSRLMAGARSAFVGPLVIAAASLVLGNVLGLISGYFGGWIDAWIMRWVDVMWSVPDILVIIVVAGALGGGYWLAVAVLIALATPYATRVVRGATLEQVPRPYVEAAKALGVPGPRIMLLHIWPNISALALANAFLVFATALVALSGLSFLGLGVSPGAADWGRMLAEGRNLLFVNPVAALAPAAMIVLTATSMNLIGDWLYERLSSRGASR